MNGIITLCGSTKFKEEFEYANRELTLNNWIVLSIGTMMHKLEDLELKERVMKSKNQLDKLHKEKILMSDSILVLNKDGYIGESTQSEINYAKKQNKTIFYLEPIPNLTHISFALGFDVYTEENTNG